MYRIITTLPRPHKFLMVPIISMVSILGAHTLYQHVTAADAISTDVSTSITAADAAEDSVLDLTTVDASGAELLAALSKRQLTAAVASSPANATVQKRLINAITNGSDADFTDELPYDDESLGNHGLSHEVAAQSAKGHSSWQSYTVQDGDSFGSIASQSLGLDPAQVGALIDGLPDASARQLLTQIRTGASIDYQLNDDDELVALRVMRNARDGMELTRQLSSQGGFAYHKIRRDTEPLQRQFAGTVSGSFGQSAQATGLSSTEVSELTRVLSKKLNFRTQSHPGDKFQVLVEADTIDGKAMSSRILAVHYQGTSTDLTLVRYNDRFYTPDGRSLETAFSRFPFTGKHNVTSPFDLTRRHPVTHRIAPHHGTDFAMAAGTMIKSPAAGKVVQVSQNPFAGRYVVIDHGDGIKTRYLHLTRSLVRQGDTVKMGAQLALSGSSGRVTGPHLHYEVLLNNRAVDPMRVKLPSGQQLSGPQLASFKRQSQQFIAKLDNIDTHRAYAKNTNPSVEEQVALHKDS